MFWMQEAKLQGEDTTGKFGWSVAIDGDAVVVGATNEDTDYGTDAGAAYIFRRIGGAIWSQEYRFTAWWYTVDNSYFGRRVAIDGDDVVVGTYGDSDRAFVYKTNSPSMWFLATTLSGADGSRFGSSVAVDGGTVVVGAEYASTVFVYESDDTGMMWLQTRALTSPDADDMFGGYLAVDGGTLFVGAYFNDEAGNDAGAVYVYEGVYEDSSADDGDDYDDPSSVTCPGQDEFCDCDSDCTDPLGSAWCQCDAAQACCAGAGDDEFGDDEFGDGDEDPPAAVVVKTVDSLCVGDGACPAVWALGEAGISSEVFPSSKFETDGSVTLKIAVATTGATDDMAGVLQVAVDCLDFDLTADLCDAGDGCVLHSTVGRNLDPLALVEGDLCPDHVTVDGNIVNLTLGVTVGVGHSDPFEALASFEHRTTYLIDVVDKVILSAGTDGIDTQHVSESLALGLAADRVALMPDASTPCDVTTPADPEEDMRANSRICIAVEATGDDKDSYVAFLRDAEIKNRDSGERTTLVMGRQFPVDADGFDKYAGAWLNDAHEDASALPADYVDFFTFFLPPKLRPAEGQDATLDVDMTVEYHHIATGERRLRTVSRELQVGGDETTTLEVAVTEPALADAGTAGVDVTLELDGLTMADWEDLDLVDSVVDAAGVVLADQVAVASVAASAGGIAVAVHVSGVDDAGAHAVAVALAADVASGTFYFRLASTGAAVDGVVLADEVAFYEAAAPVAVVDVEIQSGVAFKNLDAAAFNADAAAQLQFKKAVVAAVEDVVSTKQVTNVVARAGAARRALREGAVVDYTVAVTKTLRDDVDAAYADAYLAEVVESLDAAAADGVLGDVLRHGSTFFADVEVDVEATARRVEATTVVAAERREAADDSGEAKGAGANVPLLVSLGAVLGVGASSAAYYYKTKKARETVAVAAAAEEMDVEPAAPSKV